MAIEHVVYEDAGQLKAATVLQDAGGSLQVEASSGKRSKVKGNSVLLRFAEPDPGSLMEQAQALADEIDIAFLWEVAPQQEFDFGELAAEYFGAAPTVLQNTTLLLRLQASPVYFYRKGKGRFRPAQPDTLRAALASIERRKQQEVESAELADELVAGRLPERIRAIAMDALVARDRQSVELRAVDRAAEVRGVSVPRLLLDTAAYSGARQLLRARFLASHFPNGRPEFAPTLESAFRAPSLDGLPDAGVEAFSVDDRLTTEIDDCLSVRPLTDGTVRIGIHIAAPALAIEPGDALDTVARERMTTVYAPGEKFTMLPEPVVRAFSLDAGTRRPAASLYFDVRTETQQVVSHFSQFDIIDVHSNLRHHELDPVVDEAALERGELPDLPHAQAILALWRFANAQAAERERVRGRPEAKFREDFNFYVDADTETVEIVRRRRDSAMDRIVAEMAILANSQWGRTLAEHGVPGLYRSQSFGRVKMTTHPAEHQGLGVAQYAWSTSPLRRYVDLVNQMQLLSVLEAREPAFGRNDATLFGILSGFEARSGAVSDYQQMMERYWCLRWVGQQVARRAGSAAGRQFDAVAIREETVRLLDAPLYFRLPGMPPMSAGQRLLVEIDGWDELDLTVQARGLRLIADVAPSESLDPDQLAAASSHPVAAVIEPACGVVDAANTRSVAVGVAVDGASDASVGLGGGAPADGVSSARA